MSGRRRPVLTRVSSLAISPGKAMVDRRREEERIRVPRPVRTVASNDRSLYGEPVDCLRLFTCGKPLAFDSIFPAFVPASGQNASEVVDEFIGQLPVKDMFNLHAEIGRCEEESVHNYLWMLRWLQTCMELSQVTRDMLRDRQRALKKWILKMREKLDRHIEIHITMVAGKSQDEENLYAHTREGFFMEKNYTLAEYLTVAIDTVDMLAQDVEVEHCWHLCPCEECVFYRSPEWKMQQPEEPEFTTLPRAEFSLRCRKLQAAFDSPASARYF